jgi:hypothetical protein
MRPMHFGTSALALAAALLANQPSVFANDYEFQASPAKDLNRIFRLDRLTGEVTACQYALSPGKDELAPGAIGVTLCYPSGEGAGKQDPSSYALVASHHEQEAGVFRVDVRSGLMSVCFVFKEAVVCTPAAGAK